MTSYDYVATPFPHCVVMFGRSLVRPLPRDTTHPPDFSAVRNNQHILPPSVRTETWQIFSSERYVCTAPQSSHEQVC